MVPCVLSLGLRRQLIGSRLLAVAGAGEKAQGTALRPNEEKCARMSRNRQFPTYLYRGLNGVASHTAQFGL